MTIAYFDCFAGASGDMILGSLMDVGLEIELLRHELSKLHISNYYIDVRKTTKRGLSGSQAMVSIHQGQGSEHYRRLSDIRDIILASDLSETIKAQGLQIFQKLAEAEAKVHNVSVDEVHFHEVGAVDAIVDIMGAVIGLSLLDIQKVYCSPIHLGSGTVQCAHGILPVPAPATFELIRGKPVYSTGIVGELLTPTGAAILTTLAEDFGSLPPMRVERIGYGAGTSDPPIPNFLRLVLGELLQEAPDYESDHVAVAETNIDDMNPQIYEYLFEKILGMGALDMYLTPVQMKKNRPGTLVSIICAPTMIPQVADFLLKESTTLGLRWRIDKRFKATRSFQQFETRYGMLNFKIAKIGKRVINITPEYDDCKRLAIEKDIPLKQIMEEARAVASEKIITL